MIGGLLYPFGHAVYKQGRDAQCSVGVLGEGGEIKEVNEVRVLFVDEVFPSSTSSSYYKSKIQVTTAVVATKKPCRAGRAFTQ